MPPPHQPDDPWDEDNVKAFRMLAQYIGSVENKSSAMTTWTLGLFGGCIVIMLGFVLSAVYSTNGDLHELKGQNQTLQAEVSSMRIELTNLSQEVGIINGRHP
jgi:hypothetical protein